jgi:hypothetical protein
MAKPTDFYVGILAFFAILLSGAVAAAIFREFIPPDVLQSKQVNVWTFIYWGA